MVGQNFPISEYYRSKILDAKTLSNRGGRWTAILLIEDPKTTRPIVSLYRWQNTDKGWKVRSRMHIRNKTDAKQMVESIERFAHSLD